MIDTTATIVIGSFGFLFLTGFIIMQFRQNKEFQRITNRKYPEDYQNLTGDA